MISTEGREDVGEYGLSWGAFMIKPLTSQVTVEDARRLFGIGTDRFLISWLDLT